jgi:hypothetical protein
MKDVGLGECLVKYGMGATKKKRQVAEREHEARDRTV